MSLKENYFQKTKPNITDNEELRDPQKIGYNEISKYYSQK
jgi:hypothetical protein